MRIRGSLLSLVPYGPKSAGAFEAARAPTGGHPKATSAANYQPSATRESSSPAPKNTVRHRPTPALERATRTEGHHEVCRQVTPHGLPRSRCRAQRDVADPRTVGVGNDTACGPRRFPGVAKRRVAQALAGSALNKAQKLPFHEGHRGPRHVEQRTDLQRHVIALAAAQVRRGQRLVHPPAPGQPPCRQSLQRMHQIPVRGGRLDAKREASVLAFEHEPRDGQRLAGQPDERLWRRRPGLRRPRQWCQGSRGHPARRQQAHHRSADSPGDRHPRGQASLRHRRVYARSTDSHALCSALSAASGVSKAVASD